ncbi:MAG: hypothetical protein HOL70_00720 [Candidatus Marinimicrobia bacterium]|jgi:hypothetical protein|nr:hypothetical protein [Candidatus Neomarinimicrobiota bacterium]
METTTLNQLIETSGFLLVAAGGYLLFYKMSGYRKSISREVKLLMDCLFYRLVIEKYKDLAISIDEKSYINSYRKEVQLQMNHSPSRYSQPSEIEKRLESLGKLEKQIEDILSKVKL